MNREEMKARAAQAALQYVVPGGWLGVGTGSTVDRFIDAMAASGLRVEAAVASSQRTAKRLLDQGIKVVDANAVSELAVYIDGADEIDPRGCMIKGGGAALTREKIVADLARRFVCIADESKRVDVLGAFPLPVEVIEIACAQLIRRFAAIGGHAAVRPGVVTDNGHPIVDVRGLRIADPPALEAEINQWPGVVSVGLFARQRAALCLLGTEAGVETLVF
jgi:ribose 5-phosphate isomerase A